MKKLAISMTEDGVYRRYLNLDKPCSVSSIITFPHIYVHAEPLAKTASVILHITVYNICPVVSLVHGR